MSLGRRGSSAVRVPQFTLSPRLWISVTHVVVITESLTRDLGKLRHEGIPRASPRCCADHGLGCAPEVGLDLSSPPFPFQPQPQEPGPLLYSRSPCGWELNSALLLPRPHVPRIFSTRLQLGSTRAPPALNPTRDSSLSAPSHPHQALGVVPPLQSPQRHRPPPLSLLPCCPARPPFSLLCGLSSLPLWANFKPKLLFCPFLGCFSVGRRGWARPRKAGDEGKNYEAAARREQRERCPLPIQTARNSPQNRVLGS